MTSCKLSTFDTEDLLDELSSRGESSDMKFKDEIFHLYSTYRTASTRLFDRELDQFFQRHLRK